MKVAVLGAGVVGVAAAWYLRKAGHDVQVIDRRAGPGLETSFANGGQISADHAAPWAKPGVPMQALRWLFREDAPLLFRLRADPAQWRWSLAFLRNCTAARYAANAAKLQELGRYSRSLLRALREETGLRYDQSSRGILVLYTEGRNFEPGMKTPEECLAIEPAVASLKYRLVGGRLYPEDESGDAYKFTSELAKLCAAQGVKFDFGISVQGFSTQGQKITAVKTQSSSIEADAFVLALGSYSPLLARPLGIDLPIYPLKGYSVTMPVKDPGAAWTMSLSDEAHKLVLSRMGERLRIAGTAELNGYDTSINETRCRAIVKRVMELFPGAADPARAEFWMGLRPATPDNLPCLGGTKYSNLFLDTGHGTLGWTHACGSGKLLADLLSGRRPEIELP
jgi:D-amino-acid dehydrogenase